MFNKTVDSITKVFTQAIKDLAVVVENQTKIIDNQVIAIKEAEDKIDVAVAERSKAIAVHSKLKALLAV